MAFVVRFIGSLAILAWGVAALALGLAGGNRLWIPLGLAIAAVGVPLLGSHPWGSVLVHPRRKPPAGKPASQ